MPEVEQKIDEECEEGGECKNEYNAIKALYDGLQGNLVIPDPDPEVTVPSNNPVATAKFLYEEKRVQRDVQYLTVLPEGVNFLNHAFGGHSPTAKPIAGLTRYKSVFFSDKALLFYTLEAYKQRERTQGLRGFLNGVNGATTGEKNISTTPYVPNFVPTNQVQYRFSSDPRTKCNLLTIFPDIDRR